MFFEHSICSTKSTFVTLFLMLELDSTFCSLLSPSKPTPKHLGYRLHRQSTLARMHTQHSQMSSQWSHNIDSCSFITSVFVPAALCNAQLKHCDPPGLQGKHLTKHIPALSRNENGNIQLLSFDYLLLDAVLRHVLPKEGSEKLTPNKNFA